MASHCLNRLSYKVRTLCLAPPSLMEKYQVYNGSQYWGHSLFLGPTTVRAYRTSPNIHRLLVWVLSHYVSKAPVMALISTFRIINRPTLPTSNVTYKNNTCTKLGYTDSADCNHKLMLHDLFCIKHLWVMHKPTRHPGWHLSVSVLLRVMPCS